MLPLTDAITWQYCLSQGRGLGNPSPLCLSVADWLDHAQVPVQATTVVVLCQEDSYTLVLLDF